LIRRERVRPLNNEVERGRDFVLYWMQAAQRAEDNHALEYAADLANDRGKRLIAFFGLTEDFPEANAPRQAGFSGTAPRFLRCYRCVPGARPP
jgi:deoxyribodipyrimidine photo-lyase